MSRKPGNAATKVYQFVDTLVTVGVEQLHAALPGQPVEQLREHMTAIAHEMCFRYARTEMYIPAYLELPRSARNAEIWHQYSREAGPTGARPYTAQRLAEVATAHGLTPRQVQSIVASEKAQERAQRALNEAAEKAAKCPELPGLDR